MGVKVNSSLQITSTMMTCYCTTQVGVISSIEWHNRMDFFSKQGYWQVILLTVSAQILQIWHSNHEFRISNFATYNSIIWL